jgi:hypothetical protein
MTQLVPWGFVWNGRIWLFAYFIFLVLGNGKLLGQVVWTEFIHAISVTQLILMACLNEIILRVASSQKCCKLIAKVFTIYSSCVIFPIAIMWIISSYFVVALRWPVIWFVRSSLGLSLAFALVHGKEISYFLSTVKTLTANASRLASCNSQIVLLWVIYQVTWFVSLASFPESMWKRSIFVIWSFSLADNIVRTATAMLLTGKGNSFSLDNLGYLCFLSFCEMLSFPVEISSLGLLSLHNRQKTDKKIISLLFPQATEQKSTIQSPGPNFLLNLCLGLFSRQRVFVAFNFYRLLLAWCQTVPFQNYQFLTNTLPKTTIV